MTMTTKKPLRTALEVYRAGYQNQYVLGVYVLASQTFFQELRNAVCYELEHYGFCSLVDALLKEPPAYMDKVAYAVFCDLAVGYPAGQLADVKNSDYLPYLDPPVRWSVCSAMGKQYGILGRRGVEDIQRARDAVREGHLRYLKTLTEAQPAQQIKEIPITPVPDQKETERLRQEAEAQAAQIVENANQKAKRLKDEAQLEAERINQSAQTAADAVLAEAQAKAENGAKERADKLVQKYLAQAQREMRQACDAEMEVRLQETLRQARTLETIHGEMCDKTNTLQANWIKALDNTLEQLNAVKADFYQHLSQWQKALYPREVKALAECYLELYRMLNVDKLLREEVVFQADRPQTEPSPKTVEGLHKLNKTLTTFLRHFEAALDGLGLYAYSPQPGELFDEMRHTPEDEEEDCEGKTVQFCIQPGIAKKSNDGGEDDVVIPAEVRLNP